MDAGCRDARGGRVAQGGGERRPALHWTGLCTMAICAVSSAAAPASASPPGATTLAAAVSAAALALAAAPLAAARLAFAARALAAAVATAVSAVKSTPPIVPKALACDVLHLRGRVDDGRRHGE